MLKVDGFDECIIGVAQLYGKEGPIIVYDAMEMIEVLINEHDMSRNEAIEYFEYNISGAYLGEYTPLYVMRCSANTLEDLDICLH